MPAGLKVKRVGDDLFEITTKTAAEARALAEPMRRWGGAEEVVPGLSSLSLKCHPEDIAGLEAFLEAYRFSPQTVQAEAEPEITLWVHYGGSDGPDLGYVCEQLDLTEQGFIEQHCERLHRVELTGFTPGFCYLSGMQSATEIARRAQPRKFVPAGSVGCSRAYTGLYALAGPGGWPLIGRTDHLLFDPGRSPPFCLQAGQLVRFAAA